MINASHPRKKTRIAIKISMCSDYSSPYVKPNIFSKRGSYICPLSILLKNLSTAYLTGEVADMVFTTALAVPMLMNYPAPSVEIDMYTITDEMACDSCLKKQPHMNPKLEPTNSKAI